jgi:hypothetical protein
MKAADSRLGPNLARLVRPSLDLPTGRRRLFQSDVCAVFVIIRQILTPEASEMAFVERDDVIKHFAASTADPSFSDPVLPGAPHTRSQGLDAARLQHYEDVVAELSVPIEQDITVRAGERQSLP